jgi:phosphomannomutase
MMAIDSGFLDREQPDTIVLFDVDGTLTPARNVSYNPI